LNEPNQGDTTMAAVDRHSKSNGQGQGMNWIRKPKRLAIYLRDGLACCYCGLGVEDGAQMTLDHVTPHSLGGSNHESNLVTCCHTCNSSRGNRSVEDFAHAVATYRNHGLTAEMIVSHISACTSKKLDMAQAKSIMAARASWAACMQGE
jgi:hypothetical protein